MKSVDFPTFGLPRIEMKPDLKDVNACLAWFYGANDRCNLRIPIYLEARLSRSIVVAEMFEDGSISGAPREDGRSVFSSGESRQIQDLLNVFDKNEFDLLPDIIGNLLEVLRILLRKNHGSDT